MIEKLKKLWRGDFSLARTYWLYNFAIPLSYLTVFGIVSMKWVDLLVMQNKMALVYIAFIAFKILDYSYGAISTVGLWRSSVKYTGPALWRLLGKAMVAVYVITSLKSYWSTFIVLSSHEAFLALLEPIRIFSQLWRACGN